MNNLFGKCMRKINRWRNFCSALIFALQSWSREAFQAVWTMNRSILLVLQILPPRTTSIVYNVGDSSHPVGQLCWYMFRERQRYSWMTLISIFFFFNSPQLLVLDIAWCAAIDLVFFFSFIFCLSSTPPTSPTPSQFQQPI